MWPTKNTPRHPSNRKLLGRRHKAFPDKTGNCASDLKQAAPKLIRKKYLPFPLTSNPLPNATCANPPCVLLVKTNDYLFTLQHVQIEISLMPQNLLVLLKSLWAQSSASYSIGLSIHFITFSENTKTVKHMPYAHTP